MWFTLIIIALMIYFFYRIKSKIAQFNFFKTKLESTLPTTTRPNLTIYDKEDTINIICICDDTSDAFALLPKIFESSDYSDLIYVTLLIPENIDSYLNVTLPKHHSNIRTVIGKNDQTISQIHKLIQPNIKYTMILPFTVNKFIFRNWDRRLIHHFVTQELIYPNLVLTQFDKLDKDFNLDTKEFENRESKIYLKSINPNFCFAKTTTVEQLTKSSNAETIYDLNIQFQNQFVKMDLLFEPFVSFFN